MKFRFSIFIALLFPLSAFAQKGFVDNIRKGSPGWGTVEINQSSKLTRLVNNDSIVVPDSADKKTDRRSSEKPLRTDSAPSSKSATPHHDKENAAQSRAGVKLRRYKISGYRVQIYAGGNSRSSRMGAVKAAQRFKSWFPEVPAYTHFYPPRWVCRVGDFKTAAEARSFMRQISKLKQFRGLTIVRTAIQVVYRPSDNAAE